MSVKRSGNNRLLDCCKHIISLTFIDKRTKWPRTLLFVASFGRDTGEASPSSSIPAAMLEAGGAAAKEPQLLLL